MGPVETKDYPRLHPAAAALAFPMRSRTFSKGYSHLMAADEVGAEGLTVPSSISSTDKRAV
jgi:hypothetical protein